MQGKKIQGGVLYLDQKRKAEDRGLIIKGLRPVSGVKEYISYFKWFNQWFNYLKMVFLISKAIIFKSRVEQKYNVVFYSF